MPGFVHDRFCKHKETCDGSIDPNAYRGTCGGCRGECQNCNEEGGNCGEWQDCDCVAGACGSGHNCKKYIDITFTLKSFVIQGKTCCNASVPLAQPCDGHIQNSFTPVASNPSGWSQVTGGEQDEVIYNTTTHHVRLTKAGPDKPWCSGGGLGGGGTEQENCRCYWGGYWTSTCDCSHCCCGDGSTYPDCDCEDVGDPTEALDCETNGGSSEPCDPSNPCVAYNDGYGSSLDTWGLHNPTEQGGSSDPAFCVDSSPQSGNDPCGFADTSCSSHGDISYACWSCGNFKPHHIEAYMTMGTSPTTCDSWWILEIRGLTEQARSQMGHQSEYSLDCVQPQSPGTCEKVAGGGSAEGIAYRGRWWGASSICNSNCDDINSTDGLSDFAANGCTCPPHTTFDSTIKTDGALSALHPTAVYGGPTPSGEANGTGKLYTCLVTDSWCDTTWWSNNCASSCIEVDGQNYGSPHVWWSQCFYDANCCDGQNWQTVCASYSEGHECYDDCDCSGAPDSEYMSTDLIPNPLHPCSHCTDDPDLNSEGCVDCPAGGLESHMCADVTISIVPSNNSLPWWALA